eukprot:s3262_g3.t1
MPQVLSGFRLERASSQIEANCIFAQSLDQGPSHLTKPAFKCCMINNSILMLCFQLGRLMSFACFSSIPSHFSMEC